jgi:endonuclease G
VICGPIFYFDQSVVSIGGNGNDDDVSIPVQNAYFKSVLTEDVRGRLHMWSFVLPNRTIDERLDTFQVAKSKVERLAGIRLWPSLIGTRIEVEKGSLREYFG